MSKVTTLSEAVATIPSGAHVALSGFAIARCTMAFAREVIVSQCVGAMDADLLVGAGAVQRIVYGGGSLDRFGRLACVNRGIEDGSLCAEEYSSLSIAFRYLAGSVGLPFIPIRSLRGSSLMKQIQERNGGDVATVTDPFTGESWPVLKPLTPDVAVVQVQTADDTGNAWIMGPRWDNTEQVKASKRTIVITERLVSGDVIRQNPEATVVPGMFVSHVVELPLSAHPTSVYRAYDYDSEHIERYVQAASTREGFQAYLHQYVYGVKDHWEYLERVGGMRRWDSLRADPVLGY
jgi:glutaconate CoA-transferase subunit A